MKQLKIMNSGLFILEDNDMEFEKALGLIKSDGTLEMRLPFWNKNTCVSIMADHFTCDYLVVTSDKGLCPWIPTYPEMFSNEWEVNQCEKQHGFYRYTPKSFSSYALKGHSMNLINFLNCDNVC